MPQQHQYDDDSVSNVYENAAVDQKRIFMDHFFSNFTHPS